MFERGILTLGTHNISYAHSNEDIDRLLQVYDEVLAVPRKGGDATARSASTCGASRLFRCSAAPIRNMEPSSVP